MHAKTSQINGSRLLSTRKLPCTIGRSSEWLKMNCNKYLNRQVYSTMFSSPNGLCTPWATGYWVNAYCNCLLARSLHNQDYVKLPEKLLLICAVHIIKRFQPYAKSKFHFLFEKWANYDRYIVANGGARLIARYHRGGFSSALKTLEIIMSARSIVS